MRKVVSRAAGFLIAAAVLAALVPVPATAQAPVGSLYFTNTVVTPAGLGGTGTITFALSEAAPTAADTKAYGIFSFGALAYTNQWTMETPGAATLSGPVTVKTWVACDSALAYRPGSNNGANNLASSRATLLKGTTVIAQGDRFDTFAPCTGPNDIHELAFTIDSKDTAYAAGDTIGVQVIVWWTQPDPGVAKDGFFLVGGAAHPSSMSAAGLVFAAGSAPAVGPRYTQLTGTSVENTTRFAAATTQTTQFNWTTTLWNATLAVRATVGAGSANVTILDGAGTPLLRRSFSATGNATLDVRDAKPGAWRVFLNTTGFKGNITFSIAPTAAPGGSGGPGSTGTSGGTGGSGSGTGGAGGTGSGSSSSGKGTPAPGLLWGLAALAAALLAARRRA